MDRADIQFAVKEICLPMANPTIGSWRQLKRLARCLKKWPRAVAKFHFQERSRVVDGCSDSNWAGCRRTARSTSGGALMIFHRKEHHLVVQRSGTGGFSHGVWGEHWIGTVGCRLGTVYEREDPCRFFSATGAAHRRGNGKLRHVNFGSLWIQELVEEEEIFMCRVPGAENIADILTKHVGASLLDKHAANMGIFFPSGTVESGLHL